MPGNDWLFDNNGRMRADLPPTIHPIDRPPAYLRGYGNGMAAVPDNALLPGPAPKDPRASLADKALGALGMDRNALGGWEIKPKRWKNPTPGEDWYGIYGEANLEDVPILNRLFGYR